MNYKRYFIPNSMIFITINTYKRNPILIKNIDLIKESIKYTKTKFSFKIEAIVILKDHIHLIIQPEVINKYPDIVKYFKAYFSRHIKTENSKLPEGKKHKREKGVWQSRYWAHVILDESDLYKHIDYIHYNPFKHYNISPEDWKYSTFGKFVKNNLYDENWCNNNDKYGILKMDLE